MVVNEVKKVLDIEIFRALKERWILESMADTKRVLFTMYGLFPEI